MLSQTVTVQSSLLNRAKIVGYLNHLYSLLLADLSEESSKFAGTFDEAETIIKETIDKLQAKLAENI
jgi:hypothetical protein